MMFEKLTMFEYPLFNLIAPKTLKTGNSKGTKRKILFNRSNFGGLITTFKFLFLLYAIIKSKNNIILKLINNGVGESGLKTPNKGKIQLIANPPNIKKEILSPTV